MLTNAEIKKLLQLTELQLSDITRQRFIDVLKNHLELYAKLEKAEAELAELLKLADAVETIPFEIFCRDVNGLNWFDCRSKLRRSIKERGVSLSLNKD